MYHTIVTSTQETTMSSRFAQRVANERIAAHERLQNITTGRFSSERLRQRFPVGDNDESKLKRHVLSIDSRSRENFTTTTASNYTIRFPTISQVKKMKMLSTEIPNSQYVFRSTNNKIDLVDVGGGSTVYVVTITEGSYSAIELADEINLQLNAAVSVGFGIFTNRSTIYKHHACFFFQIHLV